MAMIPKSLPRSKLLCSCSPLSTPIRYQSTSTSSSSLPATNSNNILVSTLLSRPPLVLPQLTPLEKTYYNYQRKIHRSLSKTTSTSTDWFFKSGTTAQKSFIEFDKKVVGETGEESEEVVYGRAREGIESSREEEDQVVREREEGVTSLCRREERTLYLVVRKGQHSWEFPQGNLKEGESLLVAAKRDLKEKIGENVDVWPVGRVPAGSYTLASSSSTSSSNVFFLPMRIIRGTPVISSSTNSTSTSGGDGYAWLTKEEIKEQVKEKDYWEAVEPMLSEL